MNEIEETALSGICEAPKFTPEKERYKMYVHIKPIIVNEPTAGGRVLIQEEDQQIYKKSAFSEEEAREILKKQLLEYYHNDWEIVKIEKDKTYTV